MTPRPTSSTLRFAVFAILLLGPVAHGATPTSAETIKPSVWSDGIGFQAPGFLKLSLTVAEPDGSTTRLFAKHADGLSFGLFDDEGNLRTDGLYTYELRGLDPDEGSLLLGSGFFSIADGAFVDPRPPEATTDGLDKEFLAEDYYLQGSLCVGDDCQDGSAFDFTTVRLVENNLRIHFDDSSGTSAFPNNDWMLRANETASGGANLFSIVDCGTSSIQCEDDGDDILTLQAGAPARSLFVNSDGDIGLGTSVPVVELHLQDGDTPTIRLGQDDTEGFTAQSWDLGANETNFFIRDATHPSSLPFRIESGAPGNSLTVENTGEVGIGTWNPSARLDVRGDIAVTGSVDGRDVGDDGATLDRHVAHGGNPHQVTAAQIGADPSGSAVTFASAAVAAHETAFDHGPLEAKAGKLWSSQFSGNPAMASVTFDTPFPSGTNYIVLLTGNTNADNTAFKTAVRVQNDSGFTVTLGGGSTGLHFVAWLAYPLN